MSLVYSEGSSRLRWGGAVGVSLAVHGGLLSLFLIGQLSHKPPAPPPAGAIEVSLVTLPALPPTPPVEPPKPQPRQPVDQPKIKLPDVPKLVPPVPPEAVLNTPPPDPPKRAEPPPPPPEPPQAAPVLGNVAGPTINAEQAWEGQLLAALERKKRYPPAAQRSGQEDIVYVRLTLDRQGQVLDARIQRSKRFATLDAEVMDLVRRVSPLPKPPASVAGERIDLVVPVEFFLRRRR